MSREALAKISFEELLQRVREGDLRAFDELFRRSEETLNKWANGNLARNPPEGARPSDISQAFSEHVLHKFHTFKGTTAGEWFGWLKKVFRNHMNQSRRYAKAQVRDTSDLLSLDSEGLARLPSLDLSSSQRIARQYEWHRLFACIYRLSEGDQSKAIQLYHLKELPVAEIARLMNKTESSVAGLLRRGWKQIQEWMTEPSVPGAREGVEPSLQRDVEAAFMAYLRRRDAGHEVNLEAFVAEHPSCGEELRDMLHWIERLNVYRPRSSNT